MSTALAAALRLAPYRPDDAPALAALGNDLAVARMMTSIRHPFTEAMAARRIARAGDGAGTAALLAVRLADGRLAGEAGTIARGAEAEVMYWLGRPHRGRGLGRAVLDAILAHAFARPQTGAVRAESYADNPASLALLRGAGFVETGRGLDTDHPERDGPAPYLCFGLARTAWEVLR